MSDRSLVSAKTQEMSKKAVSGADVAGCSILGYMVPTAALWVQGLLFKAMGFRFGRAKPETLKRPQPEAQNQATDSHELPVT